MRPVVFHPKARDAIRSFPQDIRDRLGKALFALQIGEQLGMPLSRPMPIVGPGVAELRVRGEDGQFRAFYFTASEEGILVVLLSRKRLSRLHLRILSWRGNA